MKYLLLLSFVTFLIGGLWRCGVAKKTSRWQFTLMCTGGVAEYFWPNHLIGLLLVWVSLLVGTLSVFVLWYNGPVTELGSHQRPQVRWGQW